MGILGSSSSDSGGAGEGVGRACAAWAIGPRGTGACSAALRLSRDTGAGFGASPAVAAGSGAGVSSTSECLPVVHGGMDRNSSKVRTRGLQHFQPMKHQHLYRIKQESRAFRHLSGLHGTLAGLDDRRSPRSRPCRLCRSLCEHTSSP